MTIPFEPTRSYVYRAARYEVLPRLAERMRGHGDEPFLLRDVYRPLLAETYSQEQLDIQVRKANSDRTERISRIFGFYIPFLAENLKVFENVGNGWFRNVSDEEIEEEVAEADDVAVDAESDDAGLIYAYSFPLIVRADGKFPIKVGKTTAGDSMTRVVQQCRQTCSFEYPTLLREWKVRRVAATERAIHLTLEARGAKREAPGTEWFDTTINEIEQIVQFIQPMSGTRG